MAAQTVEISSVIDGRKIGGYQWFIIAICAAVASMDGFDAQAIGYVGPVLRKDWALSGPAFGTLVSSGLFGLMLGALFVAPLADRFGRRPVIIISTALFGLFTLASAWAQDATTLGVLRFLTGLGLGGCMPNAISITSEYSPARSRGFLVMVMFNGFTLGSLAGGIIAANLMPTYGWRGVFVVGGVLPLLLVPLFWWGVPESLRYLVASKAPSGRIAKIMQRIDPSIEVGPDTSFVVAEQHAKQMSVAQLFTDGRARRTILLWIVFFMSLLDVYMLVNWMPTLMNSIGQPPAKAALFGVALQAGGFVGSFPLGWLLDKYGARAVMAPAYLLGALAIAGIGYFATHNIDLTMAIVFLAGFGVIGGQTAANAVAAESYPTEVRSTGVGWALGVGRVGSIAGPMVAGLLVGVGVTPTSIFYISAVPAIIGALACIGLGRPAQKLDANEAAVLH
jgi:AAHS family 4-hydroxybenzoate transporter-like MFS transporter